MSYDSTQDTNSHIVRVRNLVMQVVDDLTMRGWKHDASKLQEPEKSCFDEFTPKLRAMEYSVDPESEYQKALKEMGVGLKHHYSANRHHPEFFEQDREWRSVRGFEGLYEVSNLGEVRSLDRRDAKGSQVKGQPMVVHLNPWGYPRLQLARNGKRFNFFLHTLVAEAFVKNPDCKPEVNHENGIKTDCRASNLTWATRGENVQHAVDTGLLPSPAQFVVHCVELDITTFGATKMALILVQEHACDAASAGILRAAQTGGTHKGLHFEITRIEEHRPGGFNHMSIIDVIEMLADWKAAGERHASGGDLRASIETNAERFGYGDEIKQLLLNTAEYLGWL